jgi:FKBP-type peptidyl-prolyl cis-trans isomerase
MKIKKIQVALIPVISFFIFLSLHSCLDPDSLSKAERKMIDMYLKSLGDTIYEKKTSGLYYIELVPGTGISPVEKDTVIILGRGLYLDYTSISGETPKNESYIIGSGEKIPGIDEGLRYMKQGGKARLLTPSYPDLGYHTPLLWEINLITVKPGPRSR